MTLPQPPPHPPIPAPEKKGLSGLAWTGIGCGVFAIIALAAVIGGSIFVYNKAKTFVSNPEKAVAEMIVASTPELEKVSSDDAKGEMTVRTKSGETITVSYADIGSGKFSFKDSSGKTTTVGGSTDFTDVPAWVPQVPKISGLPSVFPATIAGKSKGFYTATSDASVGEIESFVKGFAEASKFMNSSRSTMTVGSLEKVTLTHSTLPGSTDRKFTVTLTGESGKPTHVHVTYEEK